MDRKKAREREREREAVCSPNQCSAKICYLFQDPEKSRASQPCSQPGEWFAQVVDALLFN